MVYNFNNNHISFAKLGKQFGITQLVHNLPNMDIHVKYLALVKYNILNSLIAEETVPSETSIAPATKKMWCFTCTNISRRFSE